ncbi:MULTISPECIES: response regulator [Thalassobaculum]|uniref:Two-component system, chemotaxis family, response regulator CheB n=1 Tax=Thalassobaculum litoreum DSM 18839 TaxID=1123362 RepID=A0A8G2BIW6_9PROT|nr:MULTISPECIES: response regulator [Thalassobaculum]SDF61969.1 two-component system, chemotaxis family, response regulator CheB [Thalassobaculum litoreum DSM 18839]
MPKVLIVDDSKLVRLTIKNILARAEGFEVVGEAENGREGVDMARELSPDVVTLDIEMPVMDGIECLRRLKILSPAKVIVLSSLTHPASPKAVEARLVGADAVIGKPSGSVSKDVDASGGGLLVDTINRLLTPVPAGAAP